MFIFLTFVVAVLQRLFWVKNNLSKSLTSKTYFLLSKKSTFYNSTLMINYAKSGRLFRTSFSFILISSRKEPCYVPLFKHLKRFQWVNKHKIGNRMDLNDSVGENYGLNWMKKKIWSNHYLLKTWFIWNLIQKKSTRWTNLLSDCRFTCFFSRL